MTVFDFKDDRKAQYFEFWWQGYKLGRNVESMDEIDKKVAKNRFERYLERNIDSL